MGEISTIGLDLAKSVFQVHGVDAAGEVVVRRQLRRGQVKPFFEQLSPCLVGMEACPSAHHWARELSALGHAVRIMPAHYVKAYVKRGKNDAADAGAICEAVERPSMRFVAAKSAEQQGVMVLHRTRSLLVRQRTMLVNALRGHLAEFGIIAPLGRQGVSALLSVLQDPQEERLPALARSCLLGLARSLEQLQGELDQLEQRLQACHRSDPDSQRLESIPGLGPVASTALRAAIGDGSQFRSGREFAAWVGLVPRQNSTGGKARLGRICKQGDGYLRWLLVAGAMAVIRHHRRKGVSGNPWLDDLLERKPAKVAAVALANKNARIAWALLRSGERYRRPALV